ncbi:MAG: 2-C-methyl-D-erythritol 4-phosphate cytidylyltransferase [Acidobacteria bacterium]|nr:2-C-methyl-D-erythritol 4-phosphate cytidylyltransferase [Acidobacteriota bacterium]
MNIAIIVAAGTGSRFSKDTPKQFARINGKPLIAYTLGAFAECDLVDQIVLVLSEDGRNVFEEIRRDIDCGKPLKIAAGGATRADSVRNGIAAAAPEPNDIIAVHDGARPLVTGDEITRTIQAAAETGAACLCVEVNDTIKSVLDGTIAATVDRDALRRAVTPQAFRANILKQALAGVGTDETITDESMLVERLGIPVTVVEGSTRNIKVTRPEDLALAEVLLITGH